MRPPRFALALLALSATLGLAACGATWVDADNSGCSADDVEQMNQDAPHGVAEMMGNGVCKAHGMDKFAGKWRCKGHTLQVACK
jgi:hypothetical protein